MKNEKALAAINDAIASNVMTVLGGNPGAHKTSLKDAHATWSTDRKVWVVGPELLRRVLESKGEGNLPHAWLYRAFEVGTLTLVAY